MFLTALPRRSPHEEDELGTGKGRGVENWHLIFHTLLSKKYFLPSSLCPAFLDALPVSGVIKNGCFQACV
ncbi:hypothetical protein HMPREF3192_00877 [Atopobium deltae]|uniref:Uncharacterized protein n=1 Tax=Atopobium deltae TaxID=1393034 RepID=A0A133XU31_9ACTN|nr:hypothetical protein HMPREF3192_00877 [Atopobium deltae]